MVDLQESNLDAYDRVFGFFSQRQYDSLKEAVVNRCMDIKALKDDYSGALKAPGINTTRENLNSHSNSHINSNALRDYPIQLLLWVPP
mmetsp:Transcript_22939/g.49637  ORF Transcript_22939/g.49637 Transcript_22939/m.49637 type:complete len:88 (-) Transcript_22939:2572-2835(-)